MYWMHNFGGGWMMIIWWIFIILAVVGLIQWLNMNQSKTKRYSETAMDILKQRFANSEIDREEFEERKRVLQSD